jgi:hypothetical protein
MSNHELLYQFFERSIEEDYNEKLFQRRYILPQDEVLAYIRNLLEIPMDAFFIFMREHHRSYSFKISEIPQYSSIEDATIRMCQVLKAANDLGFSYVEMGVLLRHNGEERKQGADQKYGENHSKTAADFGLVQISPLSHKIFLTSIGYVFDLLSQEEQQAYLSRALLRNGFINCILSRAAIKPIVLYNEMSILSPSTINRRLPNVKGYLKILDGRGDTITTAIYNIKYK